MLTIQYIPKSILEEFVVCFYFNSSDDFEYYGLSSPTINQELFFNFGDTFEITNAYGKNICNRNWISGLQSKALLTNSNGRHRTAGVIFKPWGLYAAYGINSKELVNKAFDSSILFDINSVREVNRFSHSQFFEVLEYYLLKSLKRGKMTNVMQEIIKGNDRDDLTILPEKFYFSKKTLTESFNKLIGVSPHKFYTLKCLCKAVEELQNNPAIKLTELAYNNGYYDQSHFIRIFKEHMGLTPTEFRKNLMR